MTDDLLADLERELVAGWRRLDPPARRAAGGRWPLRAAAGDGEPPWSARAERGVGGRARWSARGARALGGTAIVVAALAVAVVALVGPGGSADAPSPRPAAPATPLRLSVLDRPATGADRAVRRQVRDYVQLRRTHPLPPRFREELPVARSVRVVAAAGAWTYALARGGDGGRCLIAIEAGTPVADVACGRAFPDDPPPFRVGRGYVAGVAFDGTTSVTAIDRAGRRHRVPVRRNAYAFGDGRRGSADETVAVRFEQHGRTTGYDLDAEAQLRGGGQRRTATLETESTPWALHLRGQARLPRGERPTVVLSGPGRPDLRLRPTTPAEGLPHHEYFFAPPRDRAAYTRIRVLRGGAVWFAGRVPAPLVAPEPPAGADPVAAALGGYPLETDPPDALDPPPERAYAIPPPPGPHVEYTPGDRTENRDWFLTVAGDRVCGVFGPRSACTSRDAFLRGDLRHTVRGQVIGIVPADVVSVRARGGVYPVRANAYRLPFRGTAPEPELVRRP